jgi:hypothetical protein
MAKRRKTRRGNRQQSSAQGQTAPFTQSDWGRTRQGFPASAAGLNAWWKQYGPIYGQTVQIVQGVDEPKLRVNGTLIDVIAGASGRERWGWRTVSDQAGDEAIQTSVDIDDEPDPTDPTDPASPGAPPSGPYQRDRSDPKTYPGYTTYQRDTSDPKTYPGYTPQGVPPRGGSWDSGASTEGVNRTYMTGGPDDMGDPTPGEPVTVEEEAFPGYDPTKQYYWDQNQNQWVEMVPGEVYTDNRGNTRQFDPTWGGAVDPDAPCPDGQPRNETTKLCPDPVDPVDPPEDCPNPNQRRANKGSMKGKCVDRPPCKPASDGTPRIRDEKTGQCVADTTPTTTNGSTNGDTPTPGWVPYGEGPNEPWDVDLSYLRDAPPFKFDYPEWVEPDPFTYAAYDQPDPFSYPEFVPPTRQEALDEDPGYQFRLDEGRKALERETAARGTRLTGATIKGLMDYGSNAASQEYQRAFDRRLQQYREGSGVAKDVYQTNLEAGQWAHQTNLGAAESQWVTNRAAQLEGWGENRENAWTTALTEYKPAYDTWYASQAAKQKAAFAKYDRQGDVWTQGMIPARTLYGGMLATTPGFGGYNPMWTYNP